MESTKEVLVRRSSNLLYFPSNLNGDLYKARPFRNNGITFTKTLDDVHLEGEWDGTENTSGAHGVAYCKITLAAGTYTLTTDANYQGQCLLNKKVDNAWVTVAQCGYGAHTKTFTLTEPTVIERLFWSNATMDKNVPIDMWMHPMLVEGDAQKEYEPYYYEYESTKEVAVRRSNNLFLPFSSNPKLAIGVDFAFSNDPTLFYTIEKNGNIHVHGTKSVRDSGFILYGTFTAPLTLKAGKTYSYKYNNAYGNYSLQSNISGTRVSVLGNNTRKFTPSVDTPITHVYADTFATNKEENIGKEYDFYINPMVVEGDTAQDYEPYYSEYEASKTGIIPDNGSLTSVVDFSTAIKGKRISITSTTSPEGSDGVTINDNDAFAYVPEYYPCQAGDIYKIEYVGQENLPGQTYRQYFIFWYDENKNYLGFYVKYTYGAYTFDPAPTNAKFFRLTYSGLLNGAVTPKEWMLPSNPKLTKVTS